MSDLELLYNVHGIEVWHMVDPEMAYTEGGIYPRSAGYNDRSGDNVWAVYLKIPTYSSLYSKLRCALKNPFIDSKVFKEGAYAIFGAHRVTLKAGVLSIGWYYTYACHHKEMAYGRDDFIADLEMGITPSMIVNAQDSIEQISLLQ